MHYPRDSFPFENFYCEKCDKVGSALSRFCYEFYIGCPEVGMVVKPNGDTSHYIRPKLSMFTIEEIKGEMNGFIIEKIYISKLNICVYIEIISNTDSSEFNPAITALLKEYNIEIEVKGTAFLRKKVYDYY